MRVKIYDINAYGDETLRRECDLRECFPDFTNEYAWARAELRDNGRWWIGGGDKPLQR
jgi:hypothetical protein